MTVNRKNVGVAVFATFITMTHLCGQPKGDGQIKNNNQDEAKQTRLGYQYLPVRATRYHKTDRNCDVNTKKERSCTGIRLREGSTKVVGAVAVNPKIIPIGSLVLVNTRAGVQPYLAVDIGGDVTGRKASERLAKREKRGEEWATRPVIDIYSPRTITEDWTTVLVITGPSLEGLKDLERLSRLKERMSIDFWMSRGLETSEHKTLLLAYNK
jgi:3D (Asp-Asp-Asp) domain-containing protein